MVSVICRRIRSERGVWGVLAMSATAGVLLALLALGLDVAAVFGAHVAAQAALGSALRAASHSVTPPSVPSSQLQLNPQLASEAFQSALATNLPAPLVLEAVIGPAYTAGPPPSLGARIVVGVELPVPHELISLPVSGEVALGWSGR